MASSNSPESPSKKRKQSTNSAHLRRDQPLFASRRPLPTLQQPPDFLTDSLNTSHIPTPSPTRSSAQPALAARPRQARPQKQSGAAFQRATVHHDKKGEPQKTDLPIGGHRQQARKPRPQQTLQGTTPRSAPSVKGPARVRTPTPPRGRQVLETSPAQSDPSPARGYNEAYQRIIEEESLAQEDSIENIDMEELDGSFNHVSQNLEPPHPQSRHTSASPSPIRAQRKPSPHIEVRLPAMDDVEDNENAVDDGESEPPAWNDEDNTRSSMDSNTSQYRKDLQRVQSLKIRPKAFSKARMGEKGSLTLENLRRRNGSNESLRSSQSAGSFSVTGSEPGVNIPKAWGRKARPGNDWLSRINGRKARPDVAAPEQQKSAEDVNTMDRERRGRNDIDEWMAAAVEVPLPTSEHGSSLERSSSHSIQRHSTQRQAPTNPRHTWNVEDDFTGRSLQVSDSPPLRIGKGGFESDTNREIRDIERQAVTTSRLGQLKDRLSESELRKHTSDRALSERYQSQSPPLQDSHELRRISSDPSGHSNNYDVGQESIDGLLDDIHGLIDVKGEAVADTPVIVYKSKRRHMDGEGPINSSDQKENIRPDYQRKDSHDLLKRLARAASESPSPDKEQRTLQERTGKPVPDKAKTPQVPKPARFIKTPIVTGAWVDQTISETPQVPGTVLNAKTPQVTGGWIDTPLPAGSRQPPDRAFALTEIKEEELPETKSAAADLVKELNPNKKLSPRKSKGQEPLPYTGPPLPKSALQNIINHAKGAPSLPIIVNSDTEEDITFRLGDSTIQSLEDFVALDPDNTKELPSPPTEGSPPSSEPSPQSQREISNQLANRKHVDPKSQTHLLSRLTNLAPSIRDSKKQIAALERSLSHPTSQSLNTTANDRQNPLHRDTCVEGGVLHDFLLPCQNCGSEIHVQSPQPLPGYITLRDNLSNLPNSLRENVTSLPNSLSPYLPSLSLLGYSTHSHSHPPTTAAHPSSITTDPLSTTTFTHLHLTLPIPRLWSWPPTSRRPRLTNLGLLTLLYTIWWIAEEWACESYCHKRWAYTMTGYGVDITAPEPPFVIFKVMWSKWGLREWCLPFTVLLRICFKAIAGVVGYLVGFMFGGEAPGRVPVSQDTRIPSPPMGPDVSMMHDEYL